MVHFIHRKFHYLCFGFPPGRRCHGRKLSAHLQDEVGEEVPAAGGASQLRIRIDRRMLSGVDDICSHVQERHRQGPALRLPDHCLVAGAAGRKPMCDVSDYRLDPCDLAGDVRVI
ncbi:hypothetical protein GW17_00054824, partial [Ensete ventricosum]